MSQCQPVEQHADAVHRYVRRRLFPALDSVDDLVQEVLLAAWRSQPAYDGAAPLQSWILGIAKHKVDDHYRQCQRRQNTSSLDGHEFSAGPGFDDQLVEAQQARRIAATLHQLPHEYRAVLLLRYWQHLSTLEIAGHLRRSEKAVERLLARARAHFRLMWNCSAQQHRVA